jgi:hypothetical protein
LAVAAVAATMLGVFGFVTPAGATGSITNSWSLSPGSYSCSASVTYGRSVASSKDAFARTWRTTGTRVLSSPKTWVSATTTKASTGPIGKKVGLNQNVETAVIKGTGSVTGWHSYGDNKGRYTNVN